MQTTQEFLKSYNKELYATFSNDVKELLELMGIPCLIGLDFADIRKILEKSTEWELLKDVDINNFSKKDYNKCLFIFHVTESTTLDDMIKNRNILEDIFYLVTGNANLTNKVSIDLLLLK